MAKAAAPAKMTFGEFSQAKLQTIDALFLMMFGLIAIGMVVGFQLR